MTTMDQDTIAALKQGDVALLNSATAQRLLTSTELARLAYVAKDGTPRVFPMMFHWNGTELVMATFGGAGKIKALQANPAVAVTIDTAGMPPEVLLIRGPAQVEEINGLVPEYIDAHRRYGGDAHAEATREQTDRPGLRMARIAVVPTWVGVLDFQTRFPGGATAAEFNNRGQSS